MPLHIDRALRKIKPIKYEEYGKFKKIGEVKGSQWWEIENMLNMNKGKIKRKSYYPYNDSYAFYVKKGD